MSMKLKYIVFVLLMLSSCIYTEALMKPTSLMVRIDNWNNDDCNQLSINVGNGIFQRIVECYFKIDFYWARGGKTFLFGKIIRNKSPVSTNMVAVLMNDQEKYVTNYKELIALPTEVKGDSIFYIIQI